MSFPTPLIHTVKTAMPEVNPMSFITAPDSGSWLGRLVQPIKDHPILFTVAAVFVGAIGVVGGAIYYISKNHFTGIDPRSVNDEGEHRDITAARANHRS